VEIPPRARDAGPVRCVALLHDAEERPAVTPRGPDLEPEIAIRRPAAIEDQLGQLPGKVGRAPLLCHPGRGGEHDLQRRQPLLPVDDEARVNAARLNRLLVQHDRAQEMPLPDLGRRVGDIPPSGICNVLPQDTPVFLLIPDISPLVNRDDELDAPVEQVVDRLSRRLLHSRRLVIPQVEVTIWTPGECHSPQATRAGCHSRPAWVAGIPACATPAKP
jgi:hypothetical protein